MDQSNSFTKKLRARCGTINCIDESCRDAFSRELSIVEAFIDAVESDCSILADGEKTTIEDLDDSNIEAVVTRLKSVALGNSVSDYFPLQDDNCHHPGCACDHEYDDEYFHDHCDLCNTWLHINMPINIVRHTVKKIDFSTCDVCTTDEKYIIGGYTDDSGKLQRIRADSDALIRMVDVAYKRAHIEGIESGQDFFEKREQFKSTYETIMNAIATEWNMSDDDNFNFLNDHANNLLESLYIKKLFI